MFRKPMYHHSHHDRHHPHGSGKPAMLTQIRKQQAQVKHQKPEKKYYSTVRSYHKIYKPLGTFIEVILRLRGVVHVICAQHAEALLEKKNTHTSMIKHAENYFFYHKPHDKPSPAAPASCPLKPRK